MAKSKGLDKEYLSQLGKRIAEVRKSKKMTQVELGHRCDIEKPNMSRIEKGGNNLTILTLRKICRELEVSVTDLLKGVRE